MQTDVAVSDGAITGTLKYLSTGAIPQVWGPGNFMALKFSNAEASKIRVGMDPSVSSGFVELDEDMNGVFKVTDKDSQKFVVQSYDDEGHEKTQVFDLSGLTVQGSE